MESPKTGNESPNESSRADVTVIGAGPAGLSAAVSAAHQGAMVIVIDNADQPGGQYWRHRSERIGPDDGSLHHGWRTYLRLREQFDEYVSDGRIRYFPFTAAIMASPRKNGSFSITAAATAPVGQWGSRELLCVESTTIILATGCFDRHIPLPGWTLPGVMAAGGIQAFAKSQGFLPGKRFVIAGTGPFLLSVASTVLQLGGEVAAICEANSLLGWIPQAHRAITVPEKVLEGVQYGALLARHKVPYLVHTPIERITQVKRVGNETENSSGRSTLAVHTAKHRFDDIDCVGLGWGFTPQMELAIQLGVSTRVDVDGSTVGIVNDNQESTVPGAFLAGELTGVGGAQLAVLEGRIAGKAAAQRAENTTGQLRAMRTSSSDARTRARLARFARALHTAYPSPTDWWDTIPGETVICRCEDVPISALREVRTVFPDADSRFAKGVTRAGMGPCQGRMCGFAVECAFSTSGSTGSNASHRPLAQPVPLGVLANLPEPPQSAQNPEPPQSEHRSDDPLPLDSARHR